MPRMNPKPEHRTGEEIAAAAEAKRQKNRERSKAYYWAHREEELAKVKKWREEHPEEYRIMRKRYYNKNADKMAERAKKWNQEHPERGREIRRQYYWNHREEILEKQRVKRMNATIENWNSKGADK